MKKYISQFKLEQVLQAIWGGSEPYHWQMVATMCYSYVLLFKDSDDSKFVQCMCLYQVANIHAQQQEQPALEVAA